MEEGSRAIYSNNCLRTYRTKYETEYGGNYMTCQQTAVAGDFLGPYHPIELTYKDLIIPNELDYDIKTAHKSLTLMGLNGKLHRFPIHTFLPKVQLDRKTVRRQLPRDVEVDRRRRLYEQMNLGEVLKEAGLPPDELLPTLQQYMKGVTGELKHLLPLYYFDDLTYCVQSPEGWHQFGYLDGVQYPLPALGFMPDLSNVPEHHWQYLAVYDYNKKRDVWRVMELETERLYDIPKVQLLFLAEDPFMFVKRLKVAVKNRNEAEYLLRLESVIDCAMMQDIEAGRIYPNKLLEKLMMQLKGDPAFRTEMRREVYILYEHLMAVYEFEKFSRMKPTIFDDVPTELLRQSLPKYIQGIHSVIERRNIKALKVDIMQRKRQLFKIILYYIPTAIDAMLNVANECRYIESLGLFLLKTNFSKALSLSDFLHAQVQHNINVCSYLTTNWPQKISAGVLLVLRPLGKGWLDINLQKWGVYQMCKISSFIVQIKFRMQESIEQLLLMSMNNFLEFVTKPCERFLTIDADFEWTSNFRQTEFPYAKPIFSLVIGISADEKVTYSTAPEEFSSALTDILKTCLERTNAIRYIDSDALPNLRFAPNLYILTVELIEDKFVASNDFLDKNYKQATIPLRAYAKLYERFVKFYLLDVNEFMRQYAAGVHTSLDVKEDILEHQRQKDELRTILPGTIIIGPFLIIVDTMKQYLIKKHIEITKRLFEYYVQRMYDINEQLLERCIGCYHRITERPQSIEHLFDIRKYGQRLPEVVEQLKGDIQIMWLEYEMLDSFFYNLSDHQFTMKWEAHAWPHKILMRLSTLREEQKVDIEDFMRMHVSDCGSYEEKLEALNEEVQAFSLQFDPTKVAEVSVDIKKTWKNIAEAQKQGELLTMRQKLFGLDPYSLRFLESIIIGFTPYRNLWSACSDLVKLEDATVGNPIANIVLQDVWDGLMTIRSSLKETVKLFTEKPEIQNVAKTFLDKTKNFVPIYKCIGWLKNEHWLFMHWQELSTRGEMDIKYSTAINFLYLMRKGIMKHLDMVHEISVKAEEEADTYRKQLEEEERRREEERIRIEMRKAMRKCRTDIL